MTMTATQKPAPPPIPADVEKRLRDLHARYCHEDHAEDDVTRYCLGHGHPKAKTYAKLRKLYDSLKFAANYHERYLAFASERDFATYSRPHLGLRHNYRREVTPYLEETAAQGWPKDHDPELSLGGFQVVTTRRPLVDALRAVLDPTIEVRKLDTKPETWSLGNFGFDCDSAAHALRVVKVLHEHFADCWLPPRTREDEEVDNAPLPLPYKKFTLGYGDHVRVTAHHVVVPKIPLDGRGDMVVNNAIHELIGLCEQGYPWQGDVREWMCGWFRNKKDRDKPGRQILDWDKKFKHQTTIPSTRKD